jgi:hypothetical protein
VSTPQTADVLDLVLVPRAGLTVVPVLDELVVYDRTGAGTLHRLDPRATLVWQLLDGTATVRQTASDIAEAVGADPRQVTSDVAALVGDLRDLNLVVTAASRPARRRARASADGDADGGADDASEADPATYQTGGVLTMKRTPCSVALEAEGWHATDAVRAGPYVVGIRTSDEATRAAVHARFASLLDPETVADANFSLRPATSAARGQTAQLAQVYAGCSLVGRHRTTTEALSQLARELQATGAIGDTDRPWFLGSVVIVDGDAVLAPGWLWPAWTAMASRLRNQHVQLLGRSAALDTDTGEAVLPALPSTESPSSPDDTTEQRFPIRMWLLLGTPPAGRPSPAHAMALAASCVVNLRAIGPARVLSDLASLGDRVEFVFAPSEPSIALDLVRQRVQA